MTLGRLATFLAILAVSMAMARELVHRHARPGRTVAGKSAPSPAVSAGASARKPEPVGGAASSRAESAAAASASANQSRQIDPLTDALCNVDMLLVDGTTCAETHHRCKESDPSAKDRCLQYEPAACRNGMPLRFCIDRDEYPNSEGMLPAVMITFEEAEAACKEEDKRLCTEAEWALACEGESGFVFPYGDDRDPAACNVEKKVPAVRPDELWEAREVSAVLDRVDARTPSGGNPRCVSPYGVRDMIGNVEEWVVSDTQGVARALRGGEYSSDATCLTVRKMRTEGFRQFHTGFRCCRDPLVRVPRRPPEKATPNARQNASGLARPVAPQGRFD